MKFIDKWRDIDFELILKLYEAVGWTNYTNEPEKLKLAFENSTYILLAVDEDNQLIGLTRSISDNVSIHYLQDILVAPQFQRKGVGRKLLENVLEYFKEVRTHMILTDDEEKQLKFYDSLGYKNTKDLKNFPLNSFVKMKGINLN